MAPSAAEDGWRSFATCCVRSATPVAALKKQGRSADEAVAARPTAKYDAEWGTGFVGPEAFTRLVYAGV